MLIANQKKETNIAEYLLYMFQIEDVIRAYHFDINKIIDNYIKPQLPDESFLPQYKEWYASLIEQMKHEGVEKKGHLSLLKEIIVELEYLHRLMLDSKTSVKYKELYERAKQYIEEFREKSDMKNNSDVDVLLHAMYMKLLLRLQKKEISPASEEAFDAMRVLLAYLSRSYIKMKQGDMNFMD